MSPMLFFPQNMIGSFKANLWGFPPHLIGSNKHWRINSQSDFSQLSRVNYQKTEKESTINFFHLVTFKNNYDHKVVKVTYRM